MTLQQHNKINRKKVKTLKKELVPVLNTPDGCLRVLKYSLIPGGDYPNPIVVAMREKFYGLMRRKRNGNPHFNRVAYKTMYCRLIEDIKNHSQRAGEDFTGEYSWKGTPQKKTRDITTKDLDNWGIDDES